MERTKNTTLRGCAGFRPEEHLILVTYRKDGQPDSQSLYLTVEDRMVWFHAYCGEQGIAGLIDEDVEIVPELCLALAKATVMMNGEIVGRGVGGWPLDDLQTAVQRAATSAKGRALANAGFTTVLEKDRTEFPVDAGITVRDGTVVVDRAEPALAAFVPEGQPDEPEFLKAEPVSAPVSDPVPESEPEMTLDQARALVLPFGTHKGETLGEVLAQSRRAVEWYAGPKFQGRSPGAAAVKTAAQILLNAS